MQKTTIIPTLIMAIISFSCNQNKNNYPNLNMEPELKIDSIYESVNTEGQNTSTILNSKIDNIEINQNTASKTTKIKASKIQKEYSFGELKVKLIQYKSDGSDFFCKSEIIVTKNGNQLDSARFTSDPVGGSYGISKAIKLNNHMILTKHGNYDGRTLIINKKGNIFNIIGGNNYLDTESKLLFAIYESDVSGVAIFDLKIESLIFANNLEDRPISIHKIDGSFFMN